MGWLFDAVAHCKESCPFYLAGPGWTSAPDGTRPPKGVPSAVHSTPLSTRSGHTGLVDRVALDIPPPRMIPYPRWA